MTGRTAYNTRAAESKGTKASEGKAMVRRNDGTVVKVARTAAMTIYGAVMVGTAVFKAVFLVLVYTITGAIMLVSYLSELLFDFCGSCVRKVALEGFRGEDKGMYIRTEEGYRFNPEAVEVMRVYGKAD